MNVVSPLDANVVNAPLLAVALPTGVLLIAAKLASPPIILPVAVHYCGTYITS